MYRKLSEQEHNELMKLYKQGLHDYQIAEKLFMQPMAVCNWRHANGLQPNGKGGAPQITPEEHQRRLAIYNAHKTAGRSELGRLMGLTPSGVRNWEIRYGLEA